MSAPLGLDRLPVAVVVVGAAGAVEQVNPPAVALLGLAGPTAAATVGTLGLRVPDGPPLDVVDLAAAVGDDDLALEGPGGVALRARVGGADDDRLVVVLVPAVAGAAPDGIAVVSTVSHELRSPLTSVKGYTSLLLNRWDRLRDDQKLMMLGQIQHDADRVTRLIGELLDISRLQTGQLVLRRQRVDLGGLARSVVDTLAVTVDDLDCALDLDDDVPELWADPDKLEQVVTNLVENAAKYASPRGMRLAIRRLDAAGAAHHGLDAPLGAVELAVHDRGDGIPADDLPLVFQRFFRRDHGRPTGTGLGLWISRGLVEAHGGRLEASSTVGEGSTFAFTVPLVDVDALLDGA